MINSILLLSEAGTNLGHDFEIAQNSGITVLVTVSNLPEMGYLWCRLVLAKYNSSFRIEKWLVSQVINPNWPPGTNPVPLQFPFPIGGNEGLTEQSGNWALHIETYKGNAADPNMNLPVDNQSFTISVTVSGAVTVVADFSYTLEPLKINLLNKSTGATSYEWDFGDGLGSAEVSPVHIYAEPGDYPVSLTAFGMDTFVTRTITVTITEEEPPPPPPSGKGNFLWLGLLAIGAIIASKLKKS